MVMDSSKSLFWEKYSDLTSSHRMVCVTFMSYFEMNVINFFKSDNLMMWHLGQLQNCCFIVKKYFAKLKWKYQIFLLVYLSFVFLMTYIAFELLVSHSKFCLSFSNNFLPLMSFFLPFFRCFIGRIPLLYLLWLFFNTLSAFWYHCFVFFSILHLHACKCDTYGNRARDLILYPELGHQQYRDLGIESNQT